MTLIGAPLVRRPSQPLCGGRPVRRDPATSPGATPGEKRAGHPPYASSALPGDRGAERSRVMVELLFRVELGDGNEEIVLGVGEERRQGNAPEDLLVLEVGEDRRCGERRAHDELVV